MKMRIVITVFTVILGTILLTGTVYAQSDGNRYETAVFAGGCFWGVEGVFEHVKGVHEATSGYAGGTRETANYRAVSSGRTDHAESVQVTYDPNQISYGELLDVFFTVAHDPTQLNRQGPDHGRQYRSEVFFVNESQKLAVERAISKLEANETYPRPIVTSVSELETFFPAENYHQDFMRKYPNHGYVLRWDRPKIDHLQDSFPELFLDITWP